MERWFGKYSEGLYALMRTIAGFLFACHGAQLLFGVLGGTGWPAQHMVAAAGIIELVGGILIAIGLWAGYAAFICSGQMAVAYFMVHAKNGFWPILNQGELAVLYCFVFLFIASKGSGRYSVEALTTLRS
ncbi:MAG TPA: DoxX family protein [Candidatus Acidoferrum sp.]|jgi:putative oxidoreductase